jgi:hypothetical protein
MALYSPPRRASLICIQRPKMWLIILKRKSAKLKAIDVLLEDLPKVFSSGIFHTLYA